eukprot:1725316-Pyramimonas_sp.AAC.1
MEGPALLTLVLAIPRSASLVDLGILHGMSIWTSPSDEYTGVMSHVMSKVPESGVPIRSEEFWLHLDLQYCVFSPFKK